MRTIPAFAGMTTNSTSPWPDRSRGQALRPPIEVEDTAVAALQFRNGALGVIEAATSAYPGLLKRTEIHGDRGSARVEQDDITLWDFQMKVPSDAAIHATMAAPQGSRAGASDPRGISHVGHRDQLSDFLQAIDDGRTPLVDGREGRKAVEIIRERPRGGPVKLAVLEAPAYFGEMGLLLGQPRIATVVATDDVLCYRLDKRGFDAILQARPELAGVLARVLADRQAENDATLQALDEQARAKVTVSRTQELMRRIQSFFGLGQEQSHKTETSLGADHPEIFASEDHAITPIEYVLVGLASCLTAGVAAVAQNRGIQLRSVESNLEGKMDIRGILGIDSDVRNGYDDIKVTFKIDADASKDEIEAIVAQSQKRSAVYDVITNPVNVTVNVV